MFQNISANYKYCHCTAHSVLSSQSFYFDFYFISCIFWMRLIFALRMQRERSETGWAMCGALYYKFTINSISNTVIITSQKKLIIEFVWRSRFTSTVWLFAFVDKIINNNDRTEVTNHNDENRKHWKVCFWNFSVTAMMRDDAFPISITAHALT